MEGVKEGTQVGDFSCEGDRSPEERRDGLGEERAGEREGDEVGSGEVGDDGC